MTSAVKKTTFNEYYKTLTSVLNNIDILLKEVIDRQKNLSVWHNYKNFKDFLKNIEKEALKRSAKELEITPTTIRDRWHVMTLPTSVYDAIEVGEITFSKAKLLTAIHFDFENENDCQVAEDIVEKIKDDLKNPEIKKLVEENSPKVWNPSDIVIQRIAEQHGITADSKY